MVRLVRLAETGGKTGGETGPPLANSPTMHSRVVREDLKRHGVKPRTKSDLQFDLEMYRIEANSKYNDGWTQEMYRNRIKELEERLA